MAGSKDSQPLIRTPERPIQAHKAAVEVEAFSMAVPSTSVWCPCLLLHLAMLAFVIRCRACYFRPHTSRKGRFRACMFLHTAAWGQLPHEAAAGVQTARRRGTWISQKCCLQASPFSLFAKDLPPITSLHAYAESLSNISFSPEATRLHAR